MKRILVALLSMSLALTLAACSSGDDPATGGDNPISDRENRIVGGSTFDGLPAVGTLLYNGSQHCTGTLIGPRKVLTAAHCVDGFSAARMQFGIGPSVNDLQAVVGVNSMEPHQGYNAYNITNDIAVVTLNSDAPVAPMGVVTSMDSGWVGTQLFFVGYGVSNGYNQTGAGLKRAVWMAISGVSTSTFRYDDPDRNTCNGDSGGPAFYRAADGTYLVAGVTSYGDQYCTQYGVDTRVDAYLDFLDIQDDPGQNPDPDPVDPCDGETWEGRCDGNTVVWCENDQVNRQDCGGGEVCGFAEQQGYYACVEPEPEPDPEPDPEPVDPCNGETYEGRCNGDTVVWCENEQVQTQDCAAEGQECVFDGEKRYYACREPAAPVDPCNGETWQGRCVDGSVVWCENDQVNSLNCAQSGKDCGYSAAKGYYDCL